MFAVTFCFAVHQSIKPITHMFLDFILRYIFNFNPYGDFGLDVLHYTKSITPYYTTKTTTSHSRRS